MPTVTLAYPDIGLFSNFEATRIVLPRLGGQTINHADEHALVRFEGDTDPTAFRGEGRAHNLALSVRFALAEHSVMADLLDLFETARLAADGRLMIRTNAFTDARMNEIEVVTVAGFSQTPVRGRVWDVSFTASRVAYTVGV